MTEIRIPTILYTLICATAGMLIAKTVKGKKEWREQKEQLEEELNRAQN